MRAVARSAGRLAALDAEPCPGDLTGTGFIAGLHAQEERMAATGTRLLVLRPGWFAENVAAGRALGRPDLPYVRLPAEQMTEVLVAAGFSPDAAAGHLAMTAALDDGRIRPLAGRTRANTTPTSFATVVRDLVRGPGA